MSLQARAAYRQTALETAPKSRLLVQLYERLERDLADSVEAITERNYEAANRFLIHAQDIVAALAGSLDLSVWSDADGLARVYDYLTSELTLANVEKSIPRVEACGALVRDLSEAWHTVSGVGA